MIVVVLGPSPSPVTAIVRETGCDVVEHDGMISEEFLKERKIDFAVSYRYRHIVSSDTIAALKDSIVNLHISLLPWNRGADANLWSFLEDTPKGVSVHWMDSGVDTGDLIMQEEFGLEDPAHTLASTYETLNRGVVGLFGRAWPRVLNGTAPREPQSDGGSFHFARDKEPYMDLLRLGWDTPVMELAGKAKKR